MKRPSRKALRWQGFGKNIFSEITDISRAAGAVNLAQGFPDCNGAPRVLEALSRHLMQGHNQYSPYTGEGALREAVAMWERRLTGLSRSPETEVTITSGATEAIYAVVNAFVNPGDRVVVFEPSFDTYMQAIANAGAEAVTVRLHAPDTPLGARVGGWAVDWDEFDAAVARGFSLLILNTPHNPTGRIFSREELERIARGVRQAGALVMSDEVYEHLVFDGFEHLSPAALPELEGSVVRVSSVAKTFGFTGFKLGWAVAPAELTESIRLVHQALVFCTPSHIQLGFAELLADVPWVEAWLGGYREALLLRRERLRRGLQRAGFDPVAGAGSFYLPASFGNLVQGGDAMAFVQGLIAERKVAAIPISAFYRNPPTALPWLRFTFCKSDDTIDEAIRRLS